MQIVSLVERKRYLTYAKAANAVTIDFDAGTSSGDGSDTFSGFENIIGTAKADTLLKIL